MNPNVLLALLLSWGAGINLYLTLLLAGVSARLEWIALPPPLAFLTSPWAMAAAFVLFGIEFVIDKIPYLDSVWDSFHTFVRVPAGWLLAMASVSNHGAGVTAVMAVAAALISFGTHGSKSAIRLSLNSTPEPFTNWFVSVMEDFLVVSAYALFNRHPWILLGVILVTSVLAWTAIYYLAPMLRMLFRFPRKQDLQALTWSPSHKRQR